MLAVCALISVCTACGGAKDSAQNDQQEEEPQEVTWDSIHKAFRRNGCIYLYVTPAKAFLLPSKQADAPDHEVWDFIRKRLGEDKCKG